MYDTLRYSANLFFFLLIEVSSTGSIFKDEASSRNISLFVQFTLSFPAFFHLILLPFLFCVFAVEG